MLRRVVGWLELVELWGVLNNHLAHIIEHIPPECGGAPGNFNEDQPARLDYVITDYLRQRNLDRPVVMSPDIGSIKMAHAYAKRLGGDLAVIEKRRVGDSETVTGYMIGDVRNRDVVIVDDMITSASSMARAIVVAREAGAKSIIAAATHGLFVGPACERLREAKPNELVVTDTVPQNRPLPPEVKHTVLSVSGILAEAISRIHRNKSVSLLFV